MDDDALFTRGFFSDVPKMALLDLKARSRDPWACVEPIAVIAKGRTEVHFEPNPSKFTGLVSVRFGKLQRGSVGGGRIS